MEESVALRLTRIRVYPLKGAAGVDLEESELDSFGLPGDRRWMLVGADGRFMSQRTHPRLCLLRAGPGPGETNAAKAGAVFTVDGPGMESVSLMPPPAPDEWMEVQVHKDRFRALVGEEETDRWFSHFLNEPCRLAYIPQSVHRPVDPAYAPDHRSSPPAGFRVSFSDGYPLHITTEESLLALNERLRAPVKMLRFRPNLVVEGGMAWEEDIWRRLEIGTALLEQVKPCARCTVTTVDPDTGDRDHEPLLTLKGFREWGGKVYFGQNAVFLRRGKVRTGDPVRIISRGDARPPIFGSETQRMSGETNPI
jgi:uncharacterized protein YcbX